MHQKVDLYCQCRIFAYMRLPLGIFAALLIVGCGASTLQPLPPQPSKATDDEDHLPAVLVRRPPRSSGQIDGDAVGWALFRHSHRFAACYDDAGGARSGAGVVYLLLDVERNGELSGVTIGHSDIRSERFERCLRQELLSLDLPSGESRATLQAHLIFGASGVEEGRRMLGDYRSSRAPSEVDSEQIAVPLSNLRARIQSCYERISRRRPYLRGRMVLELTVEEDGSVSDAEVSEDDLDGTLNQCVLNAVRDLRLMGEYASAATMRYPVFLEPGR